LIRTSAFNCRMVLALATITVIGTRTAAADDREPLLSKTRQLTTPAMGFTKAGEAYFSPDASLVIFQAVPIGEEHYQIYIMPTKGGTPRRISTGKGACTCGYFHPTNQSVIFAASHTDPRIENPDIKVPIPGYKREGRTYQWDFNPFMEIYRAAPDGTGLVNLTNSPGYDAEGAYSRDGKLIIFASDRDGHMNLYRMNANGSDVFQITKTQNCYNGGPFLSPDGKRVVFRADRKKKDYLQLYMIRPDGTDEIALTDDDQVNWAPYWHPNSRSIAFTTSRQGHRNYEIYLMNVENRKSLRVTNSPRFDGLPVFSNDGKQMMWTSQRSQDGSSQVFVADFELPDGY
jgi:TolB protein